MSLAFAGCDSKFVSTRFKQVKLGRHRAFLFAETEQLGAESARRRFGNEHGYVTRRRQPADRVEREIQGVTRIASDHRVKQGRIRSADCCNGLSENAVACKQTREAQDTIRIANFTRVTFEVYPECLGVIASAESSAVCSTSDMRVV